MCRAALSKSIVGQDGGGVTRELCSARNLCCLAVGGKRLEFCHTTPTSVQNSGPIVDDSWNFACCNEMQNVNCYGKCLVSRQNPSQRRECRPESEIKKYNSKHQASSTPAGVGQGGTEERMKRSSNAKNPRSQENKRRKAEEAMDEIEEEGEGEWADPEDIPMSWPRSTPACALDPTMPFGTNHI